MNASSMLSRCSYAASGVEPAEPVSHRSGYGSSQTGSVTAAPRSSPWPAAGPKSTGSSRRDRCLVMSREALVTMEYSHERTELRPSNPASPRHARSSASCDGVLGVLHRAEHPVRVGPQLSPVSLDELTERFLVSVPGQLQQRPVVGCAHCRR